MSPGSALRRAAGATLAAMWLCQEIRLATGSAAVAWAGAAAFAAYFVLALGCSRASQRGVILAVAAVAVGLALEYGMPQALGAGVDSAVLFAAFLSSMQMLRVALSTSTLMVAMRERFGLLTPQQQHDSTLVGSHLTASVLGAGSLAVVSPLLAPDAPAGHRRAFAQAALQGVGLAVLWSPFFVAMAVCVRFVSAPGLGLAVLNGLAMAAIGLALSHMVDGGTGRRRSLAGLRGTAGAVAALALAIVLANRLWHLSSLESVVIGIPVLSLVIAHRQLRAGAARTVRMWFDSLESISVEALIVGVALVLGEVVNRMLMQGIVAIPHGADAWPVPLLILMPAVVMLTTSLLGLHPIVSASCLLPVLTSITKLHGLVVIGSVLLGWMLCVMLSGFVVPVMYAASVFDVRVGGLVMGRNLRFCAGFVPVAVAYLWALNALLA